MGKLVINIRNFFILLIVWLAITGINISQFYCAPCDKEYVFVDIFPQKDKCCCQRLKNCPLQQSASVPGKGCCSRQRKACNHHSGSHHTFYRVSDLFQVERIVTFQWIATIPEEIVFDFSSDFVYGESFLRTRCDFLAEAPPLEWLCTYLC